MQMNYMHKRDLGPEKQGQLDHINLMIALFINVDVKECLTSLRWN
jgi:hypothetical protein